MIRSSDSARVKLMIAYRLHFEETNLRAVELVRTGKIGEPRIFNSTFSMLVTDPGIRLSPEDQGGGPIYDIGIYCINVARHKKGFKTSRKPSAESFVSRMKSPPPSPALLEESASEALRSLEMKAAFASTMPTSMRVRRS